MSEAVPPPLVEKLDAAIKERKFQEAYDACRDNDSFLARRGPDRRRQPPQRPGRGQGGDARRHRGDRHGHGGADQLPGDHRHPGPDDRAGRHDLGHDHELPGDRHGRRRPAEARRRSPRGSPRRCSSPSKGVSLAVPAIFFFAFFRNRIAQMAMEATKVADRTIDSLVAAAKQAKAA